MKVYYPDITNIAPMKSTRGSPTNGLFLKHLTVRLYALT